MQAYLALSDNCNSLHTNAYDEAITTPTEESVRRAMAIQMIINKEFGINVSVLCPQAVKTNMTVGREEDIAAIDGMLEPDEVAKEVLKGIKEKTFLILPHSQVLKYMKNIY